MAEGFVNIINNIQISEINLGNVTFPASSTMVQAEFSFSDPTGYKRYIISLHTLNTTRAEYTGLTLAYDVDYTTKKINATLSRSQTGSSSIYPAVRAIVIDISE